MITAKAVCALCGRAVETAVAGAKKCICGALITVTLIAHGGDPHTHPETYPQPPTQTVVVVVTTSSGTMTPG
jgi:hypothetical protein